MSLAKQIEAMMEEEMAEVLATRRGVNSIKEILTQLNHTDDMVESVLAKCIQLEMKLKRQDDLLKSLVVGQQNLMREVRSLKTPTPYTFPFNRPSWLDDGKHTLDQGVQSVGGTGEQLELDLNDPATDKDWSLY